jgi:serine/threonine-protein kinase
MGTVYRALYRKTGQRVAIKFMAGGLAANETALARFEREAGVLKQLNHRNIIRFYIASKYEDSPYYAMEYIEGEPLDHVLQRRGRLTWEEMVDYGKQMCAALQHVHEHGIVHRDLKPSNIMVTSDGTVKLADFGIAKDLDVTQLTSANCTVGTAAYMSPEQCRGERNLTHKSDLYSLGVVLYELLTGQKPFQAETTMDMFLQHVQGSFERPSRLVLDIPIWLDTLVCQLLEKKPEHRPYDAATVARALEQVAEKVTTLQSAGVDAVKARGGDRKRLSVPRDETDRRAARTLLDTLGTRRKQRKKKPFYESVWLQAAGILVLLTAIAWILYETFFRPPSPVKLYREAEKLVQSTDLDERQKAGTGPIASYLQYYGNQDDDRTKQMRKWDEQLQIEHLERTVPKRYALKMSPEIDAEGITRSALEKEEKGDLVAALQNWQEILEKYGTAPERDHRRWALLAGKRQADIVAARRLRPELEQKAKAAREGVLSDLESEKERRAVRALRFEGVGDVAAADVIWKEIKFTNEKNAAMRAWYLLAAQKSNELIDSLPKKGEDAAAVREALVKKRLTEAQELAKQPQPEAVTEARCICRDLIDLYDDESSEPAVKAIVIEARKLRTELGATADTPNRKDSHEADSHPKP